MLNFKFVLWYIYFFYFNFFFIFFSFFCILFLKFNNICVFLLNFTFISIFYLIIFLCFFLFYVSFVRLIIQIKFLYYMLFFFFMCYILTLWCTQSNYFQIFDILYSIVINIVDFIKSDKFNYKLLFQFLFGWPIVIKLDIDLCPIIRDIYFIIQGFIPFIFIKKLFFFIAWFFIAVCIFLIAAFLTLYERKLLAAIQQRTGPNIIGFLGLLQAFADAFKLLSKETSIPLASNKWLFCLSSLYTVIVSLLVWAIIPFDYKIVLLDINIAYLYLFSISSLNIYGIIVAGWASNSRYALLGALRACSQMLSYELVIMCIMGSIFLVNRDLNLIKIIQNQQYLWTSEWLCIILFFLVPVWFIALLAETYRPPFDFAEAESELVSGFNVEFPGMIFAFLFLAEYLHISIMAILFVILFLGGGQPIHSMFIPFLFEKLFLLIPEIVWFGLKLWFVLFCFKWVRATFPRFRYDQLMVLGWKILLPFVFWYLIYNFFLIFFITFKFEFGLIVFWSYAYFAKIVWLFPTVSALYIFVYVFILLIDNLKVIFIYLIFSKFKKINNYFFKYIN